MVLVALGFIMGGGLAGGALDWIVEGRQSSTSETGATRSATGVLFLGSAVAVVVLILAAAHGVLAWGMLKLKEWARIVSIVLAALGLVIGVPALVLNLLSGAPVGIVLNLIRIAIAAVILWYLVQPHVKGAFRGGSALPVQV